MDFKDLFNKKKLKRLTEEVRWLREEIVEYGVKAIQLDMVLDDLSKEEIVSIAAGYFGVEKIMRDDSVSYFPATVNSCLVCDGECVVYEKD